MKLSIIIVNYNMKELLEESLNSIFKSNFKDFEVIVVDNNSSDNSSEMIKKFPVKLIANKKNLGLAKALNQGIRKSNSEYIQIMHPDVIVNKNTFSKMIDFMNENKSVVVLGCKIRHPNGKIFHSAHRFPTLSAMLIEALPLKIANFFNLYGMFLRNIDFNKQREVDIIASAFLLLKRTGFLFDEDFTNWTLEWDLCYRLKQKGYKVMYYPKTEVIHYESYVPKDKLKISKEIEYKFSKGFKVADKVQRNLFLFYRKHYPNYLFLYKLFLFNYMILKMFGVFFKNRKYKKERIKSYFKVMGVCFE